MTFFVLFLCHFIYFIISNDKYLLTFSVIFILDDRVNTNGVRDREWGGSGGQVAGPQGLGGQVPNLKSPSNLLILKYLHYFNLFV